jgi:hypothetical protein
VQVKRVKGSAKEREGRDERGRERGTRRQNLSVGWIKQVGSRCDTRVRGKRTENGRREGILSNRVATCAASRVYRPDGHDGISAARDG